MITFPCFCNSHSSTPSGHSNLILLPFLPVTPSLTTHLDSRRGLWPPVTTHSRGKDILPKGSRHDSSSSSHSSPPVLRSRRETPKPSSVGRLPRLYWQSLQRKKSRTRHLLYFDPQVPIWPLFPSPKLTDDVGRYLCRGPSIYTEYLQPTEPHYLSLLIKTSLVSTTTLETILP